MKTVVVLYAADVRSYACEPLGGGKAPIEYTFDWAVTVPDVSEVAVLSSLHNECASSISQAVKTAAQRYPSVLIYESVLEQNTVFAVFTSINILCEKNGCTAVVFGFADCPFYNTKLTADLYAEHIKYFSEYCFADGYPYGLVPEIMDHGLAAILAGICREKTDIGNAVPSRDFIFNTIKTDINSYDIETLISARDYRYLRLSFSCSSKADTLLCRRLFEKYSSNEDWTPVSADAEVLCAEASSDVMLLQTLPSYYQIQIAQPCSCSCSYCAYPGEYFKKYGSLPADAEAQNASSCYMSFEKFSQLVDDIYDFSREAVISLSLWGEPLNHPQFLEFVDKVLSYDSLSLLIETTCVPFPRGAFLSSDIFRSLVEKAAVSAGKAAVRTNGHKPINWIISTDAAENTLYQSVHNTSELLEKTEENILYARSLFPDAVYPQFVRFTKNEEQLEQFYRKWKEKGQLIIQKFDACCGKLPDMKTADVSPIRRYACWHLRRELCILADGSVPLCRSAVLSDIQGNVFTDTIESVWAVLTHNLEKQLHNEYNGICRECDEYYTFNF